MRVRFVDYGASSLDVQIRAYALTRDWNEYFAIREDVFLRVNQLVAESGTSFALPSQAVGPAYGDRRPLGFSSPARLACRTLESTS